MNETVNKFLFVGDKFIPELHLKQPGFSDSLCGLFSKNKERTEKYMQAGNTDYIHKNDLDKSIKLVVNMIWLMVNIKI